MKQIVLATMVMMTMAGSVSAETSAWDYFWGTTVSQALDPKLNGWDDLWGQCQNPERTEFDCVATIAAGIGLAVLVPIAGAALVVTAAGSIPAAGTIYMPVALAGAGGGTISL